MGPAQREHAEAAGRSRSREARGGERVVVQDLTVRERDRLEIGVPEPARLLLRGGKTRLELVPDRRAEPDEPRVVHLRRS